MKTDAHICETKYAEAARLAWLSGLSIDERERDAYARGDLVTVHLINATEEEILDDYVSTEHEAVIDDRNRLRAELQTCVAEMSSAETALNLFEPEIDLATGEASSFELPDTFGAAIADAETALERCDEQIDDTLADKLAKMTTDRDTLAVRLKAYTDEITKSRALADAVRHVVRSHTTAPGSKPVKSAPKWAMHLIATLARLEKQQ